jgi:succinyl-CoA synthetase beta subunit
MKAGGVLFADTPDGAQNAAQRILNLSIHGQKPDAVLVEGRAPVVQEYYLGVTYDSAAKKPVMIFSDMGGIEIEQVAETHPERVAKLHFSI